jgi:periplasmic protein CpxP/Spy
LLCLNSNKLKIIYNMKKLILIAIAMIAIQVSAQNTKERPNRERSPKMDKFQDLTPEEMASIQTKKMTLHLDLNESQQKEIQKLNLENAIERKARMEAHKAQKADGNMAKPSKEERLKMMNERLNNQIAMKAKMKKILNDEQFAKWEKQQENVDKKREEMPKRGNK